MKAPQAPDPAQTAQVQGAMNRDTAITNFGMNAVNQVTPTGSLTYTQGAPTFHASAQGQTYYRDPTGKYTQTAPTMVGGTGAGAPTMQQVLKNINGVNRYVTEMVPGTAATAGGLPKGWSKVQGYMDPHYTATTKLSKNQQAILTGGENLAKILLGNAPGQANQLNQLLSNPIDEFNPDTNAIESRLMELGRNRLDPELDRRRASYEQDLFNRGVRPGGEAYTNSMDALNRGENDAYNQLLLTGRGQAYNELLGTHQQQQSDEQTRIGDLMGMLGFTSPSGGQGQQPNFVNTPGTQIPNVDYTGMVQDKYKADQAAYQSKMQGIIGTIGGFMASPIFGPGGFLGKSDRRLKRDIKRISTLPNGLPWYEFNYLTDPEDMPAREGLMADDVRKVRPEAVMVINGYDHVNYPEAMR